MGHVDRSEGERAERSKKSRYANCGLFAEVARVYLSLGFYPIPLNGKIPMVAGATGRNGMVNEQKIVDWCASYPKANVGLVLYGAVVIDVDDYDGKNGFQQLKALEADLGPLPATWSSTSRGTHSNSRHYFYRVPEDLPRRDSLAPHIDLLHRGHRYAVASPSIHPQTGSRYLWFSPEGEPRLEPPHFDALERLPEKWELLTRRARPEHHYETKGGVFEGPIQEWEEWLDSSDPSPETQEILHSLAALSHVGHNDLVRLVGRIHRARLERGETGLRTALDLLWSRYRATTNEANPEKEWGDVCRWVIGSGWTKQDVPTEPHSLALRNLTEQFRRRTQ